MYIKYKFSIQNCLYCSHSHDEQITKQGRNDKRSTSKNPHADLVKWQGKPLKAPLLKLPADLAPLALECFECVLRYCGDLPPDLEMTEVKCVYTVLMVSLLVDLVVLNFV
jgi:myosin XV